MKWTETATSVVAMLAILVALWIAMIDGLRRETIIISIVAIAGLGGYAIARDWLRRKER